MKRIIVGVMPQEKIRARALAIARGHYRPGPDEPKIWFPSIRAVAEVLSDENRARRLAERCAGKRRRGRRRSRPETTGGEADPSAAAATPI